MMKPEQVRKIILDYTGGLIPRRYHVAVKKWLVGDLDSEAKDAVLYRLFEEKTGEGTFVETSLRTFQYNREQYEMSKIRHARMRKLLRYAAVFLLPLMTAAGAWVLSADYHDDAGEMMECYVPDGKINRLALSDGTQVTINGGSSLIYPKSFREGKGNRNVYLRGEAHFDVSPDKSKPFIVHVDQIRVKVLRTHFSIKAYAEEETINTILEEGSVQVYDQHHSMVLMPNELACYHRADGRLTKTKVDAVKYSSWKSGNLFFENRSLDGILADLQHKYNVRFRTAPGVDMDKRYTMNFKSTETIYDVLRIIQKLTNGLKYNKQHGTINLYMERKEAP